MGDSGHGRMNASRAPTDRRARSRFAVFARPSAPCVVTPCGTDAANRSGFPAPRLASELTLTQDQTDTGRCVPPGPREQAATERTQERKNPRTIIRGFSVEVGLGDARRGVLPDEPMADSAGVNGAAYGARELRTACPGGQDHVAVIVDRQGGRQDHQLWQ